MNPERTLGIQKLLIVVLFVTERVAGEGLYSIPFVRTRLKFKIHTPRIMVQRQRLTKWVEPETRLKCSVRQTE